MSRTKLFKISVLLMVFVLCFALVACDQDPPDIGGDDIPTTKKVAGDALVDKTNPLVKWEGRHEFVTYKNYPMVMAYNTATGFTVDFYGTELKATFFHQNSENTGGNIYYQVAVDDEVLPTTNKERVVCLPNDKMMVTVTLVKDLPQGKHKLTCLKTSEPADALTGIVDISTDGGIYKRDLEADNKNLKFMFVCASGGSGYGSLVCVPQDTIKRSTANSSSLHSFNYLTARQFGADVQYVAQAGWGVHFPTNKSIWQAFDHVGILGYSPTSGYKNSVQGAKTTGKWDHSQWVPDVIIFNIGGNDTPQSNFKEADYKKSVVEMVTRLHELYPNAKMLWTHTDSKAGKLALQALTSAGIIAKGYIKSAVIPQVADDGTYGASDHHSFKSHITASDALVKYLETYGFAPVRPNVVFDDYKHFITM